MASRSSSAFTIVIARGRDAAYATARHRAPRWSSNLIALVGVYRRALTRRASDALLRGAGLAILAGLVGGLMIRNNDATGGRRQRSQRARSPSCSSPVGVAALIPLVEAQRASLWLSSSLGMSTQRRVVALAIVVGGVYVVAMLDRDRRGDDHGRRSCRSSRRSRSRRRSVHHSSRRARSSTRIVIRRCARDITGRGPASARVVVGAIAGARSPSSRSCGSARSAHARCGRAGGDRQSTLRRHEAATRTSMSTRVDRPIAHTAARPA